MGSYPSSQIIVKDTGTQIIVDATSVDPGLLITYIGSPSGASKNAGMMGGGYGLEAANTFAFKNFEVFT